MNVDTGEFQALTAKVGTLADTLAELAARVSAEAESQDTLQQARSPRHARPRHLTVVRGGRAAP